MPNPWTPELSVGFDEIDDQHQTLFRLIDDAERAARAGDAMQTKLTVRALGDFLMAHFSMEESVMLETRYPERGRHKTAHDVFLQDFLQLTREVDERGATAVAIEWLSVRIAEWVRFHIKVNDVPLGAWLIRKLEKVGVSRKAPDKTELPQ
jgi:hemerythrin-like metal-binding protein